MLKRIALVFVLSALGIQATQSNPHLDSLKAILSTKAHDTVIYQVLDGLASAYSDSAQNQSIYYWRQALEIVRKRRDRPKVAYVYSRIGQMLLERGELEESLEEYKNALSMYQYLDDHKGMGISNNDIGLVYRTWGRYDEALEHYLKALANFQSINLEEGVGIASNNLGQIYFYRDDYDKAIQFFLRYLNTSKKNNNLRAVAGASNNIAATHSALSNYDQALSYYQQALNIYDSLGVTLGVAVLSDNIGVLYSNMNQPAKSVNYHLKAVRIFTDMGNQVRLAESYKNLGNTYYKLNDYSQAIKYLLDSKAIAQRNNLNQTLKDVYLSLSNSYESQNKHRESLIYYRLFVVIKDSLNNLLTEEKLASFEVQYEADKRAKELLLINTKLEQQKNLGVIFGSIGIIFIALSFFFAWDNKKRKKEVKVLNEKTLVIRQALENIARVTNSPIKEGNALLNVSTFPENPNKIRHITFEHLGLILTAFLAVDDIVANPDVLLFVVRHILTQEIEKDPTLNTKQLVDKTYSTIQKNNILYELRGTSINLSFLKINRDSNQVDFYGNGAWANINGINGFTNSFILSTITIKKGDILYVVVKQPSNSIGESDMDLVGSFEKILGRTESHTEIERSEILKSTLEFWQASLSHPIEAVFFSLKLI